MDIALISAYRALAQRDGAAGVHRGMTALTREEWRKISLRRVTRARRLLARNRKLK